jgi:CubicO group peptidase (beta-lactamase class C family)
MPAGMTILTLLCLSAMLASQSQEARIASWLDDRLAASTGHDDTKTRREIGIVVGVIDASGTRVQARGGAGPADSPALTGDTVFEIGSITEVFTAIVLADMVRRNEVRLADPVGKYLPGVAVPTRGGRSITLEDLATHRSGLPRVPSNLDRKASNPYASYTPLHLHEFLSGYELTRDVGAQYEYSILNGGLLGEALARRAGQSYEELVRARVLDPLGMTATAITLTPALRARLAVGHAASGAAAPSWDFAALAGAAALRSTAHDLLKFLGANLQPDGPLAGALEDAQASRGGTGRRQQHIGLGWYMRQTGTRQVLWHDGETGGYHAFIGFDPGAAVGVVVLQNQAVSIDDIGLKVIDLVHAAATPVDTGALLSFVGEYELTRRRHVTVTLDGDQLVVQVTGQRPVGLVQDADARFAFEDGNGRVTFVKDAAGTVIGLVLHQSGQNVSARKIRSPKNEKARIAPGLFDSKPDFRFVT